MKDYIVGPAIGFLTSTRPKNDELYYTAKLIVESTERIPSSLNRKQKIALLAWKKDHRIFYLLSVLTGRIKFIHNGKNTIS